MKANIHLLTIIVSTIFRRFVAGQVTLLVMWVFFLLLELKLILSEGEPKLKVSQRKHTSARLSQKGLRLLLNLILHVG